MSSRPAWVRIFCFIIQEEYGNNFHYWRIIVKDILKHFANGKEVKRASYIGMFFWNCWNLVDAWRCQKHPEVCRQHVENTALNSLYQLLANYVCLRAVYEDLAQLMVRREHPVEVRVMLLLAIHLPGSSLGQLWIHAERMPGRQDGYEACCSKR